MPEKAPWIVAVTATVARHVLALIAATVTVVGFSSIIVSSTLKNWVRAHSYLIFVVWLLTIVLALVAIDLLRNRRPEKTPATDHDRESVARVITKLPPDDSVIVWLKDNFITKSIPIKYLDRLSDIAQTISLNVVDLDNPEAELAYRALGSAIEKFNDSINWNMFGSDRGTMERSYDWPDEQWRTAAEQILENRTNLVNVYDGFLRICHKNNIC